ncbi:hypothetical protein MHU86_15339 [Fragilaria crotonensis]|nr:hypothetical protein MHU86_15339 [Fragilaria crotonensis]
MDTRSNTIWFIATRPDIEPIVLPESDMETTEVSTVSDDFVFELVDCGVPETCTAAVLDMDAGGFTCKERINWLIETMGKSVGRMRDCGTTRIPKRVRWLQLTGTDEVVVVKEDSHCPPCSNEVCNSILNRCPVYERTFLCTKGPSSGGCQEDPWPEEPQCSECCETTRCPRKVVIPVKTVVDPSACPPCTQDVCRKSLCPVDIDLTFARWVELRWLLSASLGSDFGRL